MGRLGRQDRPPGPGSAECRVAGSHPYKHGVFPDGNALVNSRRDRQTGSRQPWSRGPREYLLRDILVMKLGLDSSSRLSRPCLISLAAFKIRGCI